MTDFLPQQVSSVSRARWPNLDLRLMIDVEGPWDVLLKDIRTGPDMITLAKKAVTIQ